jgi:hypothetical protein
MKATPGSSLYDPGSPPIPSVVNAVLLLQFVHHRLKNVSLHLLGAGVLSQ